MSTEQEVSLFWFRRDLRLTDNTGLQKSLKSGYPVIPIFIYDKNILEKFEGQTDRRVDYINQALCAMHENLKLHHSGLKTFYGRPKEIFNELCDHYSIKAVYANRDYEPDAIERDKAIYKFLKSRNIAFIGAKDQVIFDKDAILTHKDTPYKVYTPYAKSWRKKLTKEDYAQKTIDFKGFLSMSPGAVLSLEDIGYKPTDINYTAPELNDDVIDDYDKTRDFPAKNGTTRLGIALRFGTISIRRCVRYALKHNKTWLSELIWREFYMQILYHYPKVVHHSFKKKYDTINWRNNEREFEAWCLGNTGFPIVDAGMRELNQTGYMHNRVRMIVASFLVKDLLIDWRWGEAYFAQKLNDYDLAANNGNWQWAAGSGCDAAPYFRIFNPISQTKKFDPQHTYIKKWVPEYATDEYRPPMVDHKKARKRALAAYGKAVKRD